MTSDRETRPWPRAGSFHQPDAASAEYSHRVASWLVSVGHDGKSSWKNPANDVQMILPCSSDVSVRNFRDFAEVSSREFLPVSRFVSDYISRCSGSARANVGQNRARGSGEPRQGRPLCLAIASRSFTLVYASLHKRYYVKTDLREEVSRERRPGFEAVGERGKKRGLPGRRDESWRVRSKANPKAKCFHRDDRG